MLGLYLNLGWVELASDRFYGNLGIHFRSKGSFLASSQLLTLNYLIHSSPGNWTKFQVPTELVNICNVSQNSFVTKLCDYHLPGIATLVDICNEWQDRISEAELDVASLQTDELKLKRNKRAILAYCWG